MLGNEKEMVSNRLTHVHVKTLADLGITLFDVLSIMSVYTLSDILESLHCLRFTQTRHQTSFSQTLNGSKIRNLTLEQISFTELF